MINDITIDFFEKFSSMECNLMTNLSKFKSIKIILKRIVAINYNQVCSQTLLKKKKKKIVSKLCPLKYWASDCDKVEIDSL